MASAAEFGSLPFEEQIQFFRDKVNVPTRVWTDILNSQHDQAFMIAGAANADLLNDLRRTVDSVIAEGMDFRDFRRDFRDIAARHGWAYNGGEGWRANVIYETNLYQSYNAGRDAQMRDPDVVRARPWKLYRHSGSENPRPEHLDWDGLVLRHDDPFWDDHTPQNGWGCKCQVFTLSDADLDRQGLRPSRSPRVQTEQRVIGGRSGNPQTVTVPKGVDPGFQYRPGRRWHPDIDRYPESVARELVARNLRTGVFDRWHDFVGLRMREMLRQGESLANLSEARRIELRRRVSLNESFAVAVVPESMRRLLGLRTRNVRLSDDTAAKQIMSRAREDLPPSAYQRVQQTMDDARVVIRAQGETSVWITEGRSWYLATVKGARNGSEAWLTSFRRSSKADMKRMKRRAAQEGWEILRDA